MRGERVRVAIGKILVIKANEGHILMPTYANLKL